MTPARLWGEPAARCRDAPSRPTPYTPRMLPLGTPASLPPGSQELTPAAAPAQAAVKTAFGPTQTPPESSREDSAPQQWPEPSPGPESNAQKFLPTALSSSLSITPAINRSRSSLPAGKVPPPRDGQRPPRAQGAPVRSPHHRHSPRHPPRLHPPQMHPTAAWILNPQTPGCQPGEGLSQLHLFSNTARKEKKSPNIIVWREKKLKRPSKPLL